MGGMPDPGTNSNALKLIDLQTHKPAVVDKFNVLMYSTMSERKKKEKYGVTRGQLIPISVVAPNRHKAHTHYLPYHFSPPGISASPGKSQFYSAVLASERGGIFIKKRDCSTLLPPQNLA